MAHLRRLHLLPGDEAGELHDDPHQHHRPGLRSLAGQGHDPGEDALPALAGDHFVHIGDIGVGVPRHVVDPAAAETGNRRHQQHQGPDIAQPGVVQQRVGERAEAEQHHHHPVRRRRSEADAQRDHGNHRDELENRHRAEQVRGKRRLLHQDEHHVVGKHGVKHVLGNIASEVHAQVLAEDLDPQRRGELDKQAAQALAEGEAFLLLFGAQGRLAPRLARALPGKNPDKRQHQGAEHREDQACVKEGDGVVLAEVR